MTRLTLRTPSRLHFGLLSWGSKSARQFGGVGLMIDAPGLEIIAQPSEGRGRRRVRSRVVYWSSQEKLPKG